MTDIIQWLKAVQPKPSAYSEELFAQGVNLLTPHLNSKLLREHYKNLLKAGRRVPAIRKKLLYQQLLRVAKMADAMAEKKSELSSDLPELPAELPTAEAPPAETPPAETPPAETPPAETPPEKTLPEEAPPAETPPAEAPKAAKKKTPKA